MTRHHTWNHLLVVAMVLGAGSALVAAGFDDSDLQLTTGVSATVGSCGDPATISVHGAAFMTADDIRAAIGGDLDLLSIRRDDAPRAAWLTAVADAVRAGYRLAGFRDAQVVATAPADHVELDIVEGPRSVYGDIMIAARPEWVAMITHGLVASVPASNQDIGKMDLLWYPFWQSGDPMNWHDVTETGMARDAEYALHAAGWFGRIGATFTADPGRSVLLNLVLNGEPKPVLLGDLHIFGLAAEDGAAMHIWLALHDDARADEGLRQAVEDRLRACGRFRSFTVQWEDMSALPPVDANPGPPPAPLPREIGERNSGAATDSAPGTAASDEATAAEASRVARITAIAARGRRDLLITVQPLTGVPLPWLPSPTMDCALATRTRTLALLQGDQADLVFSGTTATLDYRFVWSVRHGLAVQVRLHNGQVTTVSFSDQGLLGRLGTAPPIHIGMSGKTFWLSVSLTNNPVQESRPNISLQAGINDPVAMKPGFHMLAALDPAACAQWMLAISPGNTAKDVWKGPELIRTRTNATGAVTVSFVDPSQGLAMNSTYTDGTGKIALVPGAWIQMVNPLAAAPMRTSVTVGELLDLAAGLGLFHLDDPLRALIAPVIIDAYLLARLSGIRPVRTQVPFAIPGASFPQGSPLWLSSMILQEESVLGASLPATAWPRCFLRAITFAYRNDTRAAVDTLRLTYRDPNAGPLAFLACACFLNWVGWGDYTPGYAETGVTRCTADGLVADARTFAAFAPDLLPALSQGFQTLAATDPLHRDALHDLAALCHDHEHPPGEQLVAVARRAAGLGACAWLRSVFERMAVVKP